MHPTKNDLTLATRKNVTTILAGLLADSSDLYSQCKQAHWNVRGPGFIALHELFDKLSAEVNGATDLIAERMRQLGSDVSGTVRVTAVKSRLEEYPLTTGTCEQHVDALSSVLCGFNIVLRAAIDETAEAGDAVTTDMLAGIACGLDKQLWFIESHLPAASIEVQGRLNCV